MNKPHKWAKELIALAEGKELEFSIIDGKAWTPLDPKCHMFIFENQAKYEIRIKREPREFWLVSNVEEAPLFVVDNGDEAQDFSLGGCRVIRVREVLP